MAQARYSTEPGVWAVLPFDINPPDKVMQDGQKGVTRATYDQIVEGVEAEITVRLDKAEVPLIKRRHRLIGDAANLLVAAQITRKILAYKELSGSYFADANIKLKLFLDGVVGDNEGQGQGELITAVGEVLTDTDLADSGLGISVFRGLSI